MIVRGLEDEARSPKYAHVERERRWLVDPARCPELEGQPYVLIEDRYIDGTRMRLRRMTESANGQVQLKLGKKYETADRLARPMVTTYLTQAEFDALATLPAHALKKRRHPVACHGAEFGIDLFEDALAGLALSEIECKNDAELHAMAPPDWALREVSHDQRFDGGTLVHLGIPKD